MPGRSSYQYPIFAGLCSAALFLISARGAAGSVFLSYLPLLPLFLIGLSMGAAALRPAIGAGCVLALLGAGFGVMLYGLMAALPAYIFSHHAVLFRDTPQEKQWYPLARIFALLAGLASALFGAIALFYASDSGGLQALISEALGKEMEGVDPSYAPTLHRLVHDWSFLLLGCAGWLWMLMIYANACAAQWLLKERGASIRPDLSIRWDVPPKILLFGLALAAVLAISGHDQAEFIGKTITIVLLWPYLLLGLATLHQAVRGLPGRSLLIFLCYAILIATFWPVFVVAFAAVVRHVAALMHEETPPRSQA